MTHRPRGHMDFLFGKKKDQRNFDLICFMYLMQWENLMAQTQPIIPIKSHWSHRQAWRCPSVSAAPWLCWDLWHGTCLILTILLIINVSIIMIITLTTLSPTLALTSGRATWPNNNHNFKKPMNNSDPLSFWQSTTDQNKQRLNHYKIWFIRNMVWMGNN